MSLGGLRRGRVTATSRSTAVVSLAAAGCRALTGAADPREARAGLVDPEESSLRSRGRLRGSAAVKLP